MIKLDVLRCNKKEGLVLVDDAGEEYGVLIMNATARFDYEAHSELEVRLALPYPYTIDFNAGES